MSAGLAMMCCIMSGVGFSASTSLVFIAADAGGGTCGAGAERAAQDAQAAGQAPMRNGV